MNEFPDLIGVKETPHLVRKVAVSCDGRTLERVVSACKSEGWARLRGRRKPYICEATDEIVYGAIEYHPIGED